MPDLCLTIWEFKRAPSELRAHVPAQYKGGWVACFHTRPGAELVEFLISRNSSHLPVFSLETEDGRVIVAGADADTQDYE